MRSLISTLLPRAALLLCVAVLLLSSTQTYAVDAIQDRACGLVLEVAKSGRLQSGKGGEFYCESSERDPKGMYIIVDLQRTSPAAPAARVGSNKVGWFAVDPTSGAVYEWDVGEMTIGAQLRAGKPSKNEHRN
jgi:hypothetical protein